MGAFTKRSLEGEKGNGGKTYQKNCTRDDETSPTQHIDTPAIKCLHNERNNRVQQTNVPRIKERVVESGHISISKDEPMESVSSDHCSLNRVEDCETVN